jgi:hypothetical protein
VTYEIQVQMLEIYNESLRDLLVENANAASNKLEILNTQVKAANIGTRGFLDICSTEPKPM